MKDYGYKVTLEADCGSKRFVAYHDDRFFEYHRASEEALDRMSAQYCPRCGEVHSNEEYFPVHVERGEYGYDGQVQWRNAYPTRVDEWAQPELFS